MAEVNYDIEWTDKSKEDLREVYRFLCGVTAEERAFTLVENLISEADILMRMPLIGQREPKFEGLEKTYRRLVRGNYKNRLSCCGRNHLHQSRIPYEPRPVKVDD